MSRKKAKLPEHRKPFHLTWRERGDFAWHEQFYPAVPKGIAGIIGHQPARLEDVRTGQVLHCSFDLRQEVFFATHPERFPKLAKSRRYWKLANS